MIAKDSGCSVCGGSDLGFLAHVAEIPVHCNLYYRSRDRAQQAPKAAFDLRFCRNCGHIFNTQFERYRLQYGPEYENSQAYSLLFSAYLHSLALRLVNTYDFRKKQILEIGCGQGEFLKLLCELGQNSGTGVDPGYRPFSEGKRTGNIQYDTAEFDPERIPVPQNGLICFRHVLEHLDRPSDFLRRIRERLQPGAKTIIYCEVPNAEFMIRTASIWDLLYEHCSYFVRKSLVQTFLNAGFRILSLREDFGGQFLCCEAMVSSKAGQPDYPCVPESVMNGYAEHLENRLSDWRARVHQAYLLGERIGIWGAGTKGVMLANHAPPNSVEYLIDINPCKQGKFVACTGHAVIAPLLLRHAALDRIFFTNPAYQEEIEKTLMKIRQPIPIELV